MTKRHNLAGLTKWMERDPWHYHFLDVMAEHTAEACEEAGITVPAVADVLGQQAAMVVWGAAFEDFLTRPYGEDARTVVDDYLKRRGWKETPVNRCYMEAVRDSVMSLYEVSAIIPDESFLARDLIRGGDLLRISERSATTMLKPWDRIAARIVDVNGKTMMTGGTLVLDHETADSLVEHFSASPEAVRQKFRELANKTAELVGFDLGDLVNHRVVLGISAHEFTLAWLKDSLRRALHPPKVVNCDGDAIAFHTVRYPLAAGAAADAVRVWLRGNDALREESDTFWNWVEYDSTSPRRPGDAQTFITKMADGATVLGTIKLIENALVLQVNSEARAVRGQAMLAPLLVELVGSPSVSAAALEPGEGEDENATGALPLSDADQKEAIQAYLDDHYHSVLDQPVKMLDDETPRSAARTPRGRAKLAGWLKYLENQTAANRYRGLDYDFGWMWTELGVADLRQ